MRRRRPVARAWPDERAERKGRHRLSLREARRLIGHDEDRAPRELRAPQQRRQEPPQPGVAGRDGAVVHVVAEVRRDERKGRQPAAREVAGELRQRDDTAKACPARDDVAKVEERHVLLRVAPVGAARVAGARQPLGVALPAEARALERVRKVPAGDDARGAVRADPVRRAGDESEVVGQARVRHPAVAGEHRIAAGQGVEIRRSSVAEHLALGLVLEHDDDHVLEARHALAARGSAAERGDQDERERDQRGEPHVSFPSIRFLQMCTPTTASTTSATTPAAP